MSKVDIISGFLGAGKTTLIKKLIAEVFSGQKIVLIENEFGEIGIDGGFLKDAGINITEMNSGCICCSLVGDFGKALKEVSKQFSPDRIIIEPSGVGKLSDVSAAVEKAAPEAGLELNVLATVADATKIKLYMKNFGEFYNNQIESAATVILSRTQNLSEEQQIAAAGMIKEKNPEATVITTPWDQLTGAQILSAMEKTDELKTSLLEEARVHSLEEENEDEDEHDHHEHDHHHHHHHHDHDADDVFTSWGRETPRQFTKEELEKSLKALDNAEIYGSVLRAKGILPVTDGSWLQFDYVPGEYEIRGGSADYTGRLCVIGSDLNENKLEELFHLV